MAKIIGLCRESSFTMTKTPDNTSYEIRNTQYVSRFTTFVSRLAASGWFISVLLFLLAFIPRVLDLDRFLTPDEFLWVDRSRNFLAGLTNPNYQCDTRVETWRFAQGLACTLRTGHPGVTTMWSGCLGFWLRWLGDGRPVPLSDYVVAVSTNPLDVTFIAPERLGVVLLTSLGVVVFYWLARRLFGSTIALIGAVLLALNPFHIAYSRVIHHDALSTTFMTLSVLCVFVYWGESQGRRWLGLAGVLGGLAFLSKLSSLYLMPFIALIGLWFFAEKWLSQRKEGPPAEPQPSLVSKFLILIFDGLLWFALAILTVVGFWPAMWVVPLETLQTVLALGFQYSTGPHAKGVFFLGQSVADPGPLFYPVTWLYHTSPLVMLGLIGGVVVWFLNKRRSQPRLPVSSEYQIPPTSSSAQPKGQTGASALLLQPSSLRLHSGQALSRYLPLILLFIFGYYFLMTVGEKKQERYFLPVYPWIDLLAAAGLVALVDYGVTRFALRVRGYAQPAIAFLLPVILLINSFLVAVNYPYYFTYYNPLLGGINSAAKAITIGWGEGLNLAAEYLNEEIDPSQHRVASWYESTFAPFYRGPSISYAKEKGKALAGDYVVFYINQTQRQYPDEIMFDYFESRFEPVKVVTLRGLDYAWVYPSLGIDHYLEDQAYTGITSLLAWQWVEGDDVVLIPGQSADFELYWEYLGKEVDEPFFFRLVDAHNRVWAEGLSRPVAGENSPLAQWREGEIIYERGTLSLPADIPPGQYHLQIGFYTKAPAVAEGELLFAVPDDEAVVTVGHAENFAYTLPPPATSIQQSLGSTLTLLGATWPTEPITPGATIPLDLYWRVAQPLPADFKVHLGLMDEGGDAQQAWFDLSLAEVFNPVATTWQPGDIIHTRWQLELLPEAPPGRYYFEVVMRDDIEQTISFGEVTIKDGE
ncbi:MAG: glycosyltransferase family 39 protein [Anaerolineae bacterium]|nr:glycosyltransferase family 39 protein [Anaerolineae bacterium]